jgi:hypothetical protein
MHEKMVEWKKNAWQNKTKPAAVKTADNSVS